MTNLPTYFKRAKCLRLVNGDYIKTNIVFSAIETISLTFEIMGDCNKDEYQLLSAIEDNNLIIKLVKVSDGKYNLRICEKSNSDYNIELPCPLYTEQMYTIELSKERVSDEVKSYHVRVTSCAIQEAGDADACNFIEYYGIVNFKTTFTEDGLCIGKNFNSSISNPTLPINIYNLKIQYYASNILESKEFVPGAIYFDSKFAKYVLLDKSAIGEVNSDYGMNSVNNKAVYYSILNDDATVSSKANYNLDLETATNLTIKEGSVAKIQDKDGQVLWEKAKHKYGNNAYGIRWKNNDVNNVERVGNMNLHMTLPIQTRLKTCCFNHINGKILYADPNDRRLLTENEYNEGSSFIMDLSNRYTQQESDDLNDTKYFTPFGKPTGFISSSLFTNDMDVGMFLYNYVVLENYHSRTNDVLFSEIVFVQGFDRENQYLYYKSLSNLKTTAGDISISDSCLRIKIGFPINGYYGSVMVDTGGSFYLWSEEAATDDDYNYVWISEEKPTGVDAQYIPRMLVSADTVAIKNDEIQASDQNSNVLNDYWGYLGKLDAGASICCRNFSPELRGGNGSKNEDFMLQPIDSSRADMAMIQALSRQGKPQGVTSYRAFANAHDLNGMTGLSYVTYKAIFWLYTIEYASFNVTKDYQYPVNNLKQGGLGEDAVTHLQKKSGKDWNTFNHKNPINMCLSSIDIGTDDCYDANGIYHTYRNDGICDTTGAKYTSPKAYRGIEWIFGDRGVFLGDIISLNSNTFEYAPYSSLKETSITLKNSPIITNQYITSFQLNDYAELIPKSTKDSSENTIGCFSSNVSDSGDCMYTRLFGTAPLCSLSIYTVIGRSELGYLGSVQQIVMI